MREITTHPATVILSLQQLPRAAKEWDPIYWLRAVGEAVITYLRILAAVSLNCKRIKLI
jgi:hypothetical protein